MGASPTPSSHGGEAGDTGDAGQDLRDDVASLEEGLSQMGAPSQDALQIHAIQQSPSEQSLSPEH